MLIWQRTTFKAKYWRELTDVACTFFLPRPYWIIELFISYLFLLNILDIFSGKNLMKKNTWHFIIFGKMNGPNQTPLPLTLGWLKVLPMGLCYIKAYFYWKIGRASKTNSNKLYCVLPNLKPKIVPWKIMMKISGWNLEVLYFLRLTRKVLTYFAMLMFPYLRYVMSLAFLHFQNDFFLVWNCLEKSNVSLV